jgi:hypothetical protein
MSPIPSYKAFPGLTVGDFPTHLRPVLFVALSSTCADAHFSGSRNPLLNPGLCVEAEPGFSVLRRGYERADSTSPAATPSQGRTRMPYLQATPLPRRFQVPLFPTFSAARSRELSPGEDDRGCQLWAGLSHRSQRHLASRDEFHGWGHFNTKTDAALEPFLPAPTRSGGKRAGDFNTNIRKTG